MRPKTRPFSLSGQARRKRPAAACFRPPTRRRRARREPADSRQPASVPAPVKRGRIHALRPPVLIWHASVDWAATRAPHVVNALDLGGTLASPALSQTGGRRTSAFRRTQPHRPGTGALCRYEWLWHSFVHAHAEGRSSAAAPSMSRRTPPPARRSSSRRRRGRPRRGARPPIAVRPTDARSCGAPCAGRPAPRLAAGSPPAPSPKRCRRPTCRRPTRRRPRRPSSARAAARRS